MEHLIVKPMFDQVLIKFEVPPRKTAGGVHLAPDPKSEEYLRKGTILAMGKDAKDEDQEMQYIEGERVYVAFNCGAEVERHYRNRHADTEGQIKLIKYKDVLARIIKTDESDKKPNKVTAMDVTDMVAKRDSNIIT